MAARSPHLSRAPSSSGGGEAGDNAFRIDYVAAVLVGHTVDVTTTDGKLVTGILRSLNKDALCLGYARGKVRRSSATFLSRWGCGGVRVERSGRSGDDAV